MIEANKWRKLKVVLVQIVTSRIMFLFLFVFVLLKCAVYHIPVYLFVFLPAYLLTYSYLPDINFLDFNFFLSFLFWYIFFQEYFIKAIFVLATIFSVRSQGK